MKLKFYFLLSILFIVNTNLKSNFSDETIQNYKTLISLLLEKDITFDPNQSTNRLRSTISITENFLIKHESRKPDYYEQIKFAYQTFKQSYLEDLQQSQTSSTQKRKRAFDGDYNEFSAPTIITPSILAKKRNFQIQPLNITLSGSEGSKPILSQIKRLKTHE